MMILQFTKELTFKEFMRVDTTVDQRFIIDSAGIDSSTLRVYVAASIDSSIGRKYKQVDNILNLK